MAPLPPWVTGRKRRRTLLTAFQGNDKHLRLTPGPRSAQILFILLDIALFDDSREETVAERLAETSRCVLDRRECNLYLSLETRVIRHGSCDYGINLYFHNANWRRRTRRAPAREYDAEPCGPSRF